MNVNVPTTEKHTPDPLGCNDQCGARVADMTAAMAAAWTYLEITKRWRCPACRRVLDDINAKGTL